jgi:hypothetical protein
MASNYSDPKDFVLHISSELLNEYLKKRHNVDFPVGEKKEKRDECADRFIEFIYEQSERLRNEVFMELEYINSLSSERYINALCSSFVYIEREKVIESRAKTYDERALLLFTLYPNEFDDYYARANIEEFGVRELTLPSVVELSEIDIEDKLDKFEELVQGVYRKSLKGEKCKIKKFEADGNLILRAYLEDLPTRDTVFEGKTLDEKHIRKPVFDVVFIYKPSLHFLGVRALGGKDVVHELQSLFCFHFLGIKNIDTEKERYSLSTVQDIANLNLVASASYGVERVYLKAIRLKNKAVPHKIYIDVGGKEPYSGTDAVQDILKELNLDISNGWDPTSIKITVVFQQTGRGRRKQVTVTITPPNTCNLKNRPQDDVVRQLLADWGIYVS